MSRFLIDAQLPPALADRLMEAGHEAYHVHRIGLGAAPDRDVWKHACAIDAALISKDIDFLALSNDDPPPISIIWVRWGNVTNKTLWQSFAAILPQIEAAIAAKDRVIELG